MLVTKHFEQTATTRWGLSNGGAVGCQQLRDDASQCTCRNNSQANMLVTI
jgi:hypothetical protein